MATTIRKHYDQLLLDNISAVSTIESGIRNVTWLLPGRFQDAEVASEGLYTLLRLVSSYHDTIISKRIKPSFSLPPHPFDANTVTPKAAPTAPADASNATQPIGTLPRVTPLLPPPSDHTRYTRYWAQTSTIYRKASRTIAVLGYVELLVEMLARKRGERARWRIVAIIEAVKTFLRLVLLRLTRRPVLSHPVPYREYDPASLPPEIVSAPSDSSAPSPQASSSSTSPASSTDKREPILPHLRGSTLRSHLQPLLPALPESHQPHPLTLSPELDGRGYAAEMLAGSATLVHVLLLLRWARRHPISPYKPLSLPTLSRPLLPFLLPLLMRLVARHLRSPLSSSSPSPQSTALLAEHYASQDRTLLMTFFFTGPMWIGWTRPKIQSWIDWFGRWPGGGLIGGFAEGYLPLVDDLFYYTSS